MGPSEKKKSDSKERSNDPSYRAYKKVRSSKTWDHKKHEKKNDSCDVCNGRMTKEELSAAKIEREKRRKERKEKSSNQESEKTSSSGTGSSKKDEKSSSKDSRS